MNQCLLVTHYNQLIMFMSCYELDHKPLRLFNFNCVILNN